MGHQIWRKGDAFQPETFADLLPEVDGVVHTLGTLIEDSRYKNAMKDGDFFALVRSFCHSVGGEGTNPLGRLDANVRRNSYDAMNRDSAISVCQTFLSSNPPGDHLQNTPRPFVYISAEDIFRPLIPARYIETKREAEAAIETLLADKPDYRGVYIRPSLVYHAHHRPLTTPLAALFDFSATVHSRMPPTVPTPSSVLRALSDQTGTSALESMANALTIPPIHVDHVAEAICTALDSSRLPAVSGVVGVKKMRELIGWSDETCTNYTSP